MSNQNWRTPVDAEDYFTSQQKKLNIADRRPVIRRPSDLVGPGIAADAVRITDWNDALATFNGFFSSAAGALNAPDLVRPAADRSAVMGWVTGDPELGGIQEVRLLRDGLNFTRTFTRNPNDPSIITWSTWMSQSWYQASARNNGNRETLVPQNSLTVLNPPALTIGTPWYQSTVFTRTENVGINILRYGSYSGHVYLRLQSSTALIDRITLNYPISTGSESMTLYNVPANNGVIIPFNFYTNAGGGSIQVSVLQTASSTALRMLWDVVSVYRVQTQPN